MTAEERQVARELETAQEYSTFRRWFWDRRDPDPSTIPNELREEFNDRLAFVNKEFGDVRGRNAGWRTDPGMVYLLLGPPSAVGASDNRPAAGRESPRLVVWTYEDEDLQLEKDRLRVFFVSQPSGLHLAGTPKNVGHPLYKPLRAAVASLESALTAAVREKIRSPDLPLGAPGHYPAPSSDLPLQAASLRLDDSGLAGEFQLSPKELYGQPRDDGMRIRIDLGLVAGSVAHDDPPDTDGTAPGDSSLIGVLVFNLDREDLARRAETPLRVALWLPHDVWTGAGHSDAAPELALTERPTGRRIVLRTAEDRRAVPELYAVDEIVGVALLAENEGLAVAFFEADPGRRKGPLASPSGLWLSREPGEAAGEVPSVPAVDGLRVLRRGGLAYSGSRDTVEKPRH